MLEINADAFWLRFDKQRDQMTIEEICERSGVSSSTVRGLRSNHKLPNLQDTVRLTKIIGCSIDYLVSGNIDRSQLVDKFYKADSRIQYTIAVLLNL